MLCWKMDLSFSLALFLENTLSGIDSGTHFYCGLMFKMSIKSKTECHDYLEIHSKNESYYVNLKVKVISRQTYNEGVSVYTEH